MEGGTHDAGGGCAMTRKVDTDQAAAMYRAGTPTRAIANHFGVQPPAITRALAKAGVAMTKRRPTMHGSAQRDRMAELVSEGASVKEAGKAMGLTESGAFWMWKQLRAGLGWQAR